MLNKVNYFKMYHPIKSQMQQRKSSVTQALVVWSCNILLVEGATTPATTVRGFSMELILSYYYVSKYIVAPWVLDPKI